MDPIFTQFNSWKIKSVDKKDTKTLAVEAENKVKSEIKERELTEQKRKSDEEEKKKYEKLNQWSIQTYGMEYNSYKDYIKYLENRTPEQFHFDMYHDKVNYFKDNMLLVHLGNLVKQKTNFLNCICNKYNLSNILQFSHLNNNVFFTIILTIR